MVSEWGERVSQQTAVETARDRYLMTATWLSKSHANRIEPLFRHRSTKVRTHSRAVSSLIKRWIRTAVTRAHDLGVLHLLESLDEPSKNARVATIDLRVLLSRSVLWGLGKTTLSHPIASPEGVPACPYQLDIDIQLVSSTISDWLLERDDIPRQFIGVVGPIQAGQPDNRGGLSPILGMMEFPDPLVALRLALDQNAAIERLAAEVVDLIGILTTDALGLGGIPSDSFASAQPPYFLTELIGAQRMA